MPEMAEALNMLGWICEREGQRAKAAPYYERAINALASPCRRQGRRTQMFSVYPRLR